MLNYQNSLANLFSPCKVSLCERNTLMLVAFWSWWKFCCSISAQKTTKTPTRTWKLVHALHYANELLLRVRLAFLKLLQTRQTSRNYQKQVLVMVKHCLGNLQINPIPAWSKEVSYITFLYRTLAKVYALARADIIHSQRKIKEIFDLKTHPFIN